jgi:hypothetical protein
VRGTPPARADTRRAASPASRFSGRDAEHASAAAAGDGVWVGGSAGGAGGEGGWGAGGRLWVLSSPATVRLVYAGWKAVYDALVTRLVRTQQTSDEDMGMLVLRWLSLELKGDTWGCVDGRGAASSDKVLQRAGRAREI